MKADCAALAEATGLPWRPVTLPGGKGPGFYQTDLEAAPVAKVVCDTLNWSVISDPGFSQQGAAVRIAIDDFRHAFVKASLTPEAIMQALAPLKRQLAAYRRFSPCDI